MTNMRNVWTSFIGYFLHEGANIDSSHFAETVKALSMRAIYGHLSKIKFTMSSEIPSAIRIKDISYDIKGIK